MLRCEKTREPKILDRESRCGIKHRIDFVPCEKRVVYLVPFSCGKVRTRQQTSAVRGSASRKDCLPFLTALGRSQDSRFENALPLSLPVVSFLLASVRCARNDRDRCNVPLRQPSCRLSAFCLSASATVKGDGARMLQTTFRCTLCRSLLPCKRETNASEKKKT